MAGTGTKALPAVSQRAINQNIQTAYAETWDFSIQRQVMRNSVIAVDYAGSQGVHLYDIANINPAQGGELYLVWQRYGVRTWATARQAATASTISTAT